MQWLITVVKQELARLHLLSIAQATVTTVVILGGFSGHLSLRTRPGATGTVSIARLPERRVTLFRGGFFTVLIMAWITARWCRPHLGD